MLAARLGTAAVLIGGLLAALFLLPPFGLSLVAAAVAGLAAQEWGKLCGLGGARAWGYALLVAAGVIATLAAGIAAPVIAIAAAFWLALAPLWLWLGVRRAQRPLLAGAGLVVLVPAGAAMVAMTPLELLLALVLTWIADTAAYFAGRKFGRSKLAPAISPGKTWEGAYGALGATLAYAVVCAFAVGQLREAIVGVAWLAYLVAAAGLCAFSILGDLFESALKRQAGAKDSGTLLPGHGGMLDRIDSATAVLPLAAGLWALIGGKWGP